MGVGCMSKECFCFISDDLEVQEKIAQLFPEYSQHNSGAELICISKDTVLELNLPWNPDLKLNMREVNGGTKINTGVVENLQLTIAGISICPCVDH
jgi:hypothetical protein